MRVAAPTLKREAPPAAKRAGSPATNGRTRERVPAARRAKPETDGVASANGHRPARAASKPRRRTTTAR